MDPDQANRMNTDPYRINIGNPGLRVVHKTMLNTVPQVEYFWAHISLGAHPRVLRYIRLSCGLQHSQVWHAFSHHIQRVN